MQRFEAMDFVQAIDAVLDKFRRESPLFSFLPPASHNFQTLIGTSTLLVQLTRNDQLLFESGFNELTDTSYWLEFVIPIIGKWLSLSRDKYPEHLEFIFRVESENELSTHKCLASVLADLPWTDPDSSYASFIRSMSLLSMDTYELGPISPRR